MQSCDTLYTSSSKIPIPSMNSYNRLSATHHRGGTNWGMTYSDVGIEAYRFLDPLAPIYGSVSINPTNDELLLIF